MDDQHSHSIRLTSAWLPPRTGGGAWVRRFGTPSGIEPGMRVLLVIESPRVEGIVLNGSPLPAPAVGEHCWSCDVTTLLRGHNELSLTLAAADADTPAGKQDPHGRMPFPTHGGAVRLEILTPPGAER